MGIENIIGCIRKNSKIFLNISLLILSFSLIKAFDAPSSLMNLLFLVFFFINFTISPKYSYLLYIPFSLFFEHNSSFEISTNIFLPISTKMMLFKNWTDVFYNEIYKFSSFDIILLTYVLYFLMQKFYFKNGTRIHHFNVIFWGYLSYLLVFTLWGFMHDSDPFAAYWQIKPLAYLPIIYILTYYFIERINDIYIILSAILTVTLLKLSQTYYFAYAIAPQLAEKLRALSLSHEETLFYILIGFFLFFACIFSKRKTIVFVCGIMTFMSLGGLVHANRRISFALLACYMAIVSLFYRGPKQIQIRAILGIVLLVMLSLFILLVLSPARLPLSDTAKSIATGLGRFTSPEYARDFSSNYYREIERANLRLNIKDNFWGVGFGAQLAEEYEQYVHYIDEDIFSHNQILQIWALTGVPGFILFLSFWAWIISYISFLHKNSKEAVFSALCICVICYIVAYLLYSYYEMMLTEFRQNIMLGILIASVFKLKELTSDQNISTLSP